MLTQPRTRAEGPEPAGISKEPPQGLGCWCWDQQRGSPLEALEPPEDPLQKQQFTLARGKPTEGGNRKRTPSPPLLPSSSTRASRQHNLIRASWAGSPGNSLLGLRARHRVHSQHRKVGMRVEKKQAND